MRRLTDILSAVALTAAAGLTLAGCTGTGALAASPVPQSPAAASISTASASNATGATGATAALSVDTKGKPRGVAKTKKLVLGQVMDNTSKKLITGVTVDFVARNGVHHRAVTSPKGIYEIRLRSGKYVVSCDQTVFRCVLATHLNSSKLTVNVQTGGVLNLVIVAASPGPNPNPNPDPAPALDSDDIVGQVVDANGNPVAGASMDIEQYVAGDLRGQDVTTDANGRFDYPAQPGGIYTITNEDFTYCQQANPTETAYHITVPYTGVLMFGPCGDLCPAGETCEGMGAPAGTEVGDGSVGRASTVF